MIGPEPISRILRMSLHRGTLPIPSLSSVAQGRLAGHPLVIQYQLHAAIRLTRFSSHAGNRPQSPWPWRKIPQDYHARSDLSRSSADYDACVQVDCLWGHLAAVTPPGRSIKRNRRVAWVVCRARSTIVNMTQSTDAELSSR